MQNHKRRNRLIQKFKIRLSSSIQNQAYKIILATINRYRILIIGNIIANLLAAALEGTTFGSIFLALKVIQSEQSGNIFDNTIIANSFVVDFLNQFNQGQLFIGLIILAVLMQFLRHSFDYLGRVSADYLSARVQFKMVDRIFQQIIALSFPCASSYKVGDLIAYITQSASSVNILISNTNLIIIGAMTIIAQAIVLFTISPALSSITIFICVLLLVIQKRIIPKIKQASREVTRFQVDNYKKIIESIQALRVIHTFARQSFAIKEVHQLQLSLVPRLEYKSRLSNLSEPLSKILTLTMVAALLLIGFLVLKDSRVILPSLITFLAVLNRLSMYLNSVIRKINIIAENTGDFERLQEILDPKDKYFTRAGGNTFISLKEKIEFCHVSLQYPESQDIVLQDISLNIDKGKVTALVGGSGAGKSSVSDLLIGLYEPTQGRILVDGIDIHDYSIESWRSHIGVVSQDTFMFNQSILDNIRYGKLDATEGEIINAARIAQADQFIQALPEGYKTIVGERGYRLSGGQRQRLTLARAILKQPEILILDEATSALDSQSERLLQEALSSFQKARTVLVIAHRLSTIVGADQIIVLEQGKIKERGTHKELINMHGHYAYYWKLQNKSLIK